MIAKSMLISDNLSIIFIKKGRILYQSSEKSLTPFINALEICGGHLRGSSLADRLMGKAAALLAIYAGIQSTYALTMSSDAIRFLKQYNIGLSFGNKVNEILNTTGTGICPFEKKMLNIDDPEEAYKLLRNKL
jgi:hypothetical protein